MKTILIKTDGTFVVNEDPPRESDGSVQYQFLSQSVGGFIELIPFFTKFTEPSIEVIGKDCIAFCNEEGKLKNLPFNPKATSKWTVNIRNRFGPGSSPSDVLVGDVLVIVGSKKELNRL